MQALEEKALKNEIREVLVNHARQGKPWLTYTDLCELVKSVKLEPHSTLLFNLLGEISRVEYEEGRGMLSVLVVSQETKYPGNGFFQLAKELGRPAQDEIRFYIDEQSTVLQYWANH